MRGHTDEDAPRRLLVALLCWKTPVGVTDLWRGCPLYKNCPDVAYGSITHYLKKLDAQGFVEPLSEVRPAWSRLVKRPARLWRLTPAGKKEAERLERRD